MRRAELPTAGLLACAIGGCMQIEPDPDLPDVEVKWFSDNECQADTDRVVVVLQAADSGAEVTRLVVPCADASARLVDLPRTQYLVTAGLEDPTGLLMGYVENTVDLFDGLNEHVDAFFGRNPEAIFVTATWSFTPGASCASLHATSVQLDFLAEGSGASVGMPCEDGRIPPLSVGLFADTYTLSVRASDVEANAVAVAEDGPPIALAPGGIHDLGSFTLTPCGAECPGTGFVRVDR